MRLSRRAALNGNQLDEADQRIVIMGIDTGVPHESVQAVNRMSGVGQRVTGQHWETLDVAIRFGINVKRTDMAARRAVYEAAVGWAMQRGWLTINYMPGRRMFVDKVIIPSSGDLWNWTDEFTITLRAYNVPFWQSATPAILQAQDVTGNWSGTLGVPGMFRTVADVVFKNTGNTTLSGIAVEVDGNRMVVTGLNLGTGEAIEFVHENDGILRVQSRTIGQGGVVTVTSVYNMIQERSADDLFANPGLKTVNVVTSATGQLTVSASGRWP